MTKRPITTEEKDIIHKLRKEEEMEEYQYIHLIEKVLRHGIRTPNRTGIDTLTIPHAMLTFNLVNGFPLFTHKQMATKTMAVELEGFIKGITDKKWYQDRGCHIWDEWCNPKKVAYGTSELRKQAMKEEMDLGKIYGYQWRNFNSQGFDQLKFIVDQLKTNPNNRQLVCSAWNPNEQPEMALPPCHICFHVTAIDGVLNLSFFMRSCDLALGTPFNVASYALLLHLLARECNMKEGKLTSFLSNCHIYYNQIPAVEQIIGRALYKFPRVSTFNMPSIFSWEAKDTVFVDYFCGGKIKIPIAV